MTIAFSTNSAQAMSKSPEGEVRAVTKTIEIMPRPIVSAGKLSRPTRATGAIVAHQRCTGLNECFRMAGIGFLYAIPPNIDGLVACPPMLQVLALFMMNCCGNIQTTESG